MKHLLYPILTSIFFAGSFVAAKYTTLDLEPLTTSLLRYVVALLFLCMLVFHQKSKALQIKNKDLFAFFFLGLTGIVGYHYFFFLSLKFTEIANTAIINATSPVVTAIAAAFFLNERLGRWNYLGGLLAFIGVIFLLIQGDVQRLFELRFNQGDLLMLLSVVSWVIYSLIIKRMATRYSGFTLTFYATLFGVFQLFFLALGEQPLEQLKTISAESIGAIFYMGIVASGLGYLLYNVSIQKLGPTKTSSTVYSLVPILVSILAFLFFDESITLVMLFSIAGIIIGLLFVMMERKPTFNDANEVHADLLDE